MSKKQLKTSRRLQRLFLSATVAYSRIVRSIKLHGSRFAPGLAHHSCPMATSRLPIVLDYFRDKVLNVIRKGLWLLCCCKMPSTRMSSVPYEVTSRLHPRHWDRGKVLGKVRVSHRHVQKVLWGCVNVRWGLPVISVGEYAAGKCLREPVQGDSVKDLFHRRACAAPLEVLLANPGQQRQRAGRQH